MSHPEGFPMEMQFPYPKPQIPRRPGRGCRLLLERPAMEDCTCPDHGPTPEVSYMRYIRSKNVQLYEQLQTLRGVMSTRAGEILNHRCSEMDTKMNALHVVDYIKRGYLPGHYSPLGPVKVCRAGTPIKPLRVELTNGYRDPELFPFRPQNRELVDKTSPLTSAHAPASFKHWFSPSIPGQTEYENTISHFGTTRMRSTRQYLEPQPSSRLRSGDPNY